MTAIEPTSHALPIAGWNTEEPLNAQVQITADRVRATLTDLRTETVRLFGDLDAQQQEHLAEDAWSIGLRALANAYTQSQQVHLQDVGKSLMSDLERQLKDHVLRHQETTNTVLQRYFDPKDGQLNQRLQAFVEDEGVLARLLEKNLSPDNSLLSRTLAEKVGAESPLLKMLSPTESEGVVQVMEAKFTEVMESGQTQLMQSLDPLHEGGTMARFITSLRTQLTASQEDRDKQLAVALGALNANDENSLISRLMRETHEARKSVMDAVNPNLPGSPMTMLTTRLTQMLEEHVQTQSEGLEQQRVRQEKFEVDIREAVTRIETQKRGSEVSTAGGYDFEDAMVARVSASLSGGPFLVKHTGGTTGAVRNAKVGDLVVQFTEESAFCGSAIVFEAKRDSSYSVMRALDELERARANREAKVGIFVMAASHAPVGFPRFARYGQDILVTWDDTDAHAVAWLEAATIAGLALASRSKRPTDDGDIRALSDIEHCLEAEIKRLEKMETLTSNVSRDAGKLAEEVRKGKDKLKQLVGKGKAVLLSLEVEVTDVESERASPIMLSAGPESGEGRAPALGDEAKG